MNKCRIIPCCMVFAISFLFCNTIWATPKLIPDKENFDIGNNCTIEITDYTVDCGFEGLFFDLEYSAFNISEVELLLNGEEGSLSIDTIEGNNLRATAFLLQPPLLQDYTLVLRDVNDHLCADTLFLEDFECDPCGFISYSVGFECEDDSTYTFIFESRDPNGPIEIFLDDVFVGTHTDGEPDFR